MRSRWKVAIIAALGLALLPACNIAPPLPVPPSTCETYTAPPAGLMPRPTTPPPTTGTSEVDDVTVNLADELGPTNQRLTGLVWNTGSNLDALAPLTPKMVRIDASLGSISPSPDQFDLSNLLAKIAEVRRVGAEPLVLLSYMPPWLGQERAGTDDATRYAPSDMDAWQNLIERVVRGVATAPEPAYRFEVWNEPDLFVFWRDTPAKFAETAVRTTRAVANVKAETGLPLQVGGPALAIGPGPLFGAFPDVLTPYVQGVVAEGLPLDFISWHHYANTPFLGPDGAEGNVDDALYNALKGVNPNATPLDYSSEIAAMRTKLSPLLAGTDLHPELSIDEWNVSGGGYDHRHDSAEGAALIAGTLTEMERAGLDEASIYRALGSDHAGDWGIVTPTGVPKPNWWVFRAWRSMNGTRLATSGDVAANGLWARATRGTGTSSSCVSVLLSSFVATGSPTRIVNLDFEGALPKCRGPRIASATTLDSASTAFTNNVRLKLDEQSTRVAMAPQSVSLVRVGCGLAPGDSQPAPAAVGEAKP